MVRPITMTFGSDPELFLERGGAVIGSEKVLPETGLRSRAYHIPTVVLDGVQVELNPPATASIVALGGEVSLAFAALRTHLASMPEVSCCFRGVVEVSREELDSLSEKSRILGCNASENIYGVRPITVAKAYRKRSAGGHAHFGLRGVPGVFGMTVDERCMGVPLLDMFVGNLCVLLDRDPGAQERRENYGRAGEYRLPHYGLEYRTLSNFWLRNYTLMSFVFGMSHFALSVLSDSESGSHIEKWLVEHVPIEQIIRAIDTNDWNLARANLDILRPFLVQHLPEQGFPLTPGNLDRFITMVEGVRDMGLERFFPEDHLTHWAGNERVEFDTFLETIR